MKKIFLLFSLFLIFSVAFAQSDVSESTDDFLKDLDSVLSDITDETNAKKLDLDSNIDTDSETGKSVETNTTNVEATFDGSDDDSDKPFIDSKIDENSTYEYTATVKIPAKKRPKSADPKKLEEANKRDDKNEEFKETQNALKFGTATEINNAIAKITENEDPRYNDLLYDLFQESASIEIKGKILDYFSKIEDPCLEDYAVELLDDPYDASNSTIEKCFNYVSAVGCKDAAPALVKLLESEDEKYFNNALNALGKTGGAEEAKYLAEFLKRDDFTLAQRQSLMRTLGQMNAVETWEEISQIAQDEEENTFVRMYAAEAIGNMKKDESIPILIKIFEEGDPNLRQYCIKGLANFPNSEKAKKVILQGIRDDHYKVRLESIKAVREQKITDAVDFIIYRAKNDSETVVKKECYPALSDLNTDEAIEFLISRLKEKKVGDDVKCMAAEALLKAGTRGEQEIIELGKEAVTDDKKKVLRQNLGKLFIKYPRSSYGELCTLYLQSKDTTVQSQGLEMYKNGRFEESKPAVQAIADDKKAKGALKTKAKKLLGIEEEE